MPMKMGKGGKEVQTDTSFASDFRYYTKGKFTFLILLVIAALVMGLVFPILLTGTSLYHVTLSHVYKAGELSDEDVIAPDNFAFIDEVETEKQRENARRAVPPYFIYSLARTLETENRANSFIEAIKSGDDTVYAAFLEKNGLKDNNQLFKRYVEETERNRNRTFLLVRDAVRYFLAHGFFSSSDIEGFRKDGYSTLQSEIPVDDNYSLEVYSFDLEDVVTEKNIYSRYLAWIGDFNSEITSSESELIFDSLAFLIETNVEMDNEKTLQLRQSAASAIPLVKVKVNKGDYLMRVDTIVTERALRTIDRINTLRVNYPISQILGKFVFLLLVTLISIFGFSHLLPRKYRVPTYLGIFMVSFDVMLIVDYYIIHSIVLRDILYIDPFLPCFFTPLLLTHITNKKRFGFIACFLFSSYVILIPGSSIMSFFYYLLMVLCCLLFVRFGTNRIDMIYQAFYSCIAVSVVTLLMHMILNNPGSILASNLIAVCLNVAITYMFISIVLPLIEHFFNIPTVFRLRELSYTDTPTLNRLNKVAQGTFNHSKNVSDMAYEACKAIHANAELARVGGLYHDIGKTEHPEYFIENQQSGHNIHDDLNFTLSAAIIKSHVRLGVEKAKEIGLPAEVIDIIGQHHGNDVISYFYNEAVKEAEGKSNAPPINEDDFRYNGEIPDSPEAAVVMLADCIEAASRTLKKPTTQRYDKLIMSIIVSKMNRSQLNDSGLTMTDIDVIKATFIHVLIGRDHQRISYDDEDKDKEAK